MRKLVLTDLQEPLMTRGPSYGLRRALIGMLIALAIALMLGFSGLWPTYRMEVSNGPNSTIGKSGEMKSPGGSTETGERRI
jgi:hypothetical protein